MKLIFVRFGQRPQAIGHRFLRLQSNPAQMEVTGLKETIVRLESSLTEKQNEILFLEEEVRSLRMKLTKRDAELMKQERELNKLRVILDF